MGKKWEYLKLKWECPLAGYEPYNKPRPERWYTDDRQWPDLVDALNDLGTEEWDCVTVITGSGPFGPVYQYAVLKRLISREGS